MTDTDTSASQLNSNKIVEDLLHQKLIEVENSFGKVNALTFMGQLTSGADLVVREAIERVVDKRAGLLVLLETEGGYIEIVERIVNALRHHYKRVEFLIPDYAMSAGTVLAMSGDSIHMDYFSTLGPIDPQVQRPGKPGGIPVQGYLAQYQKLLERGRQGALSTAELNILISKFDQAEIYKFEQSVELSVTLLKHWLVEYKFKDWIKTEGTNAKVTKKMKQDRAEEIARALNDSGRWHSHGRGIPMSVLRKDLKLRIDDFGQNKNLNDAVKAYCSLLADFMMRTQQTGVVHTPGLYFGL